MAGKGKGKTVAIKGGRLNKNSNSTHAKRKVTARSTSRSGAASVATVTNAKQQVSTTKRTRETSPEQHTQFVNKPKEVKLANESQTVSAYQQSLNNLNRKTAEVYGTEEVVSVQPGTSHDEDAGTPFVTEQIGISELHIDGIDVEVEESDFDSELEEDMPPNPDDDSDILPVAVGEQINPKVSLNKEVNLSNSGDPKEIARELLQNVPNFKEVLGELLSESLKSNNLLGEKDKGTNVPVEEQKPEGRNDEQDRRVVEPGNNLGSFANQALTMTPSNPRRNNLIKSPLGTTLYKPAIVVRNVTNSPMGKDLANTNKSMIERICNFVESFRAESSTKQPTNQEEVTPELGGCAEMHR